MKILPLPLLVIASLSAACLAHANLVANGSFDGSYTAASNGSDDPAGWTLTSAADGSGLLLVGGIGSANLDLGIAAENGSSYLAFGAAESDFDSISQTVTTQSGADYALSFWVDTDASNGTPLELVASWDANQLLDLTSTLSAGSWTEYAYSLTGTGSDTLTFSGLDDNGFALLDNVQVRGPAVSVPDSGPGLVGTVALLLLVLGLGFLERAGRFSRIEPAAFA